MAETSRDYAALISTMSPDGGNNISGQDVRDLVLSVKHILEHRDRQPTSPNAWDEEFATDMGAFSACNLQASDTIGQVSPGRLQIVLQPRTSDKNVFAAKAISGTFRVETKFRHITDKPSPGFAGGFIGVRVGGGTPPNVANTTTDKQEVWEHVHRTALGVDRVVYRYTSANAFSTAVTTSTSIPGGAGAGQPPYMAITSDGTTLTYDYSYDGVLWQTFTTSTIATFLGAAPDSIIIGANQESSSFGNITMLVDYVRRTA